MESGEGGMGEREVRGGKWGGRDGREGGKGWKVGRGGKDRECTGKLQERRTQTICKC